MNTKEFYKQVQKTVKNLKRWGEIAILKRSKPLLKVIPPEECPIDLLDRSDSEKDRSQPDLQEISQILHNLRNA